MNIVVTNKYKDLINNANIEIMKELNGVFQVSEIVNAFNSIFYKKLIIDATAIDRFPKEEVLRELVKKVDLEKLILFLPPNEPPPMNFLSFLVSINIYNFTDNLKGLQELVDRSNTYEDVKQFIINSSNNNFESDIDNAIAKDTLNIQNGKIILGFKNITDDTNSTSIIYMLKKNLEEVHKKRVIAVEIDKKNFVYYNSNDMYSISSMQLDSFMANVGRNEIVLVDLNDDTKLDICSDIIYLVDPSLFKINRLLMKNRNVFKGLIGKKVILFNSLLTEGDVNIFAREAGISIYFNLPPLNDRIYNKDLDELLAKLGLIDEFDERPKKGFFDIFK